MCGSFLGEWEAGVKSGVQVRLQYIYIGALGWN